MGLVRPQASLIRHASSYPSPKIRQAVSDCGAGEFPMPAVWVHGARGLPAVAGCPSRFSGSVICIPGYSLFSFCPAQPCTQKTQFQRVWL